MSVIHSVSGTCITNSINNRLMRPYSHCVKYNEGTCCTGSLVYFEGCHEKKFDKDYACLEQAPLGCAGKSLCI